MRDEWKRRYRAVLDSPDLNFDEKVGYMVASSMIDPVLIGGDWPIDRAAKHWREQLRQALITVEAK